MNLYPIAFRRADDKYWDEYISKLTNFKSKEDYQRWCADKRFKKMRNRVTEFSPSAIICFGKSWIDDFSHAFISEEKIAWETEYIGKNEEAGGQRELKYYKCYNGPTVVVCPFPFPWGGAKGCLNSVELLSECGVAINGIIKSSNS